MKFRNIILEIICCSCLLITLSSAETVINNTSDGEEVGQRQLGQEPYSFAVDCLHLRLGQYTCAEPDIDPATQQPKGCTRDNRAKVVCTLAEGLICNVTNSNVFFSDIPCKYTNGKSWEVALLLSIFLGTFGIDRFYLGYPAIGLVKLSTTGFLLLGQLIDIILIATQFVEPSDGSHYIINYFGAGLNVLRMDNDTYKVPLDDW